MLRHIPRTVIAVLPLRSRAAAKAPLILSLHTTLAVVARGTQYGCTYAVAQAVESHPLTTSLDFVPMMFCGECESCGAMADTLGNVAIWGLTIDSLHGRRRLRVVFVRYSVALSSALL